jgi:hypothetical protein
LAAFEYPDTAVLRWVDGDTVDLRVSSVHDFGFRFRYGFTFDDRFRLYGVNTPGLGGSDGGVFPAGSGRLPGFPADLQGLAGQVRPVAG